MGSKDKQEDFDFSHLLELRENTLLAERCEDFRQFMNTVSRWDAAQVVLVRDRQIA